MKKSSVVLMVLVFLMSVTGTSAQTSADQPTLWWHQSVATEKGAEYSIYSPDGLIISHLGWQTEVVASQSYYAFATADGVYFGRVGNSEARSLDSGKYECLAIWGNRIVAFTDNEVRVNQIDWPADKKLNIHIATMVHETPHDSCGVFSPDGQRFLFYNDGLLIELDLVNNTISAKYEFRPQAWPVYMAYSTNGNVAYSDSQRVWVNGQHTMTVDRVTGLGWYHEKLIVAFDGVQPGETILQSMTSNEISTLDIFSGFSWLAVSDAGIAYSQYITPTISQIVLFTENGPVVVAQGEHLTPPFWAY